MGKETGTQKLHFRVRFEYKVLAQPFRLFRKRRDIKQEAAAKRRKKAAALQQIPLQGIDILDVDPYYTVYMKEEQGRKAAYAPVEVRFDADSLEDAIPFLMSKDFSNVELMYPDHVSLSPREFERFIEKVNKELQNHRACLEIRYRADGESYILKDLPGEDILPESTAKEGVSEENPSLEHDGDYPGSLEEAESVVEPDQDTEPVPDPDPEPDPEPAPAPAPAPVPAPAPAPEPDTDTDTEPVPDQDPDQDTDPEPEQGPGPEPVPEQDADTAPVPEQEPGPDQDSDHDPETVPEPELDQDPEPDIDPDIDPDSDPPEPAGGSLKKTLRLEWELEIIAVLSLILAGLIALGGQGWMHYLRIGLGLPFVLFFPGYVLIAALFPKKDDLDGIERVALSFGLSIAVAPLIGLGLNYTPWGIRLTPILISLIIFILLMGSISFFRRDKLPQEERYCPTFEFEVPIWREQPVFDRVLSIALVIAILFAVGSICYVVAMPKVGEQFTEFYILGTDGKAEGYPRELEEGEKGEVIVGVVNHEYQQEKYYVEIRMDDLVLSREGPITLSHENKWENTMTFSYPSTRENLKVEFLLYREGDEEPYRSLHLWVNVHGQAS